MAKKTKKTENKELFKTTQHDIFTIVENYNEGTDISICLGQYLIEKGFDCVESAKTFIDSKPYKLTVAVATISAKITTEKITKN